MSKIIVLDPGLNILDTGILSDQMFQLWKEIK